MLLENTSTEAVFLFFLDMKEIPFSWSKNHSYIYGEGRLCFALNLTIWKISFVTGSGAGRSAAGFGRCLWTRGLMGSIGSCPGSGAWTAPP